MVLLLAGTLFCQAGLVDEDRICGYLLRGGILRGSECLSEMLNKRINLWTEGHDECRGIRRRSRYSPQTAQSDMAVYMLLI